MLVLLQSNCTSGTPFVVWVTDTCATCADSQVNLLSQTYTQHLAPASAGQVPVQWRQVCSPASVALQASAGLPKKPLLALISA